MNVNPNIRQRRKSNLGKRYRASHEPACTAQLNPTAPVTDTGRLWLGKKTNLPSKPAKDSNDTKKRLMFNRTSDTSLEASYLSSFQKAGNSSNSTPGSSFDYLDNSLNMTGVHRFKTPTPEHNTTVKKPSMKLSLFSELEPPKSPGPSLYDQLVLNEFRALKPPVDPDDRKILQIENLSIENKLTPPSRCAAESNCTANRPATPISTKESKKFSPHLNSTYIGSVSPDEERKSNSVSISEVNKFDIKLDTINEGFDTTDDSFLLAEQSVIDQNETIVAPECVDKDLKDNLIPINSQNVESNLEKNVSNVENRCSESDEELEKNLEGLNQEIVEINEELKDMNRRMNQMNKRMNRMVGLTSEVKKLIKKRREKRNKILNDDKENIPNKTISTGKILEMSTKKSQKNWISSLKTDNPRLLKTPKMVKGNKTNISFAEQSGVWTPHSMTTILHEQIEDLFDD